jgi:hypothetical protein
MTLCSSRGVSQLRPGVRYACPDRSIDAAWLPGPLEFG